MPLPDWSTFSCSGIARMIKLKSRTEFVARSFCTKGGSNCGHSQLASGAAFEATDKIQIHWNKYFCALTAVSHAILV